MAVALADDLKGQLGLGGVHFEYREVVDAEEVARLRELKGRRAEIRSAPSVRVLPSPKVVEGYIRNLFECLERDPERARGLLRAHFEQSPLILTPQSEGPDRFYRATGAFNLWTPELRYSEIKVAGAGFEPATFGL